MATAIACPLCLHSSFSQVNDLVSAFLSFIQRPLFCPLCNHVADTSLAMREHLAQHLTPQHDSVAPAKQEQNKFTCKQCGSFTTNDIAILRLHVESEHPERKFLCVHCCKLFKGIF